MATTNKTNTIYGGAGGSSVYSTNCTTGGAGGSATYTIFSPTNVTDMYFGGVTKSYVDTASMNLPWHVNSISIPLPDGSVDTIERSELVKYISERKLRESNELVRAQWDRYQVTVKIVGSTDNGQENEG